MKKELTCIVCPVGCKIEVISDDANGIKAITGNSCPRGKAYAENECTNPVRVVTTTVMCSDGEVIPVKTKDAIPKDKIFECMAQINNCTPVLPIRAGDVIISNIFGTDVIATASRG